MLYVLLKPVPEIMHLIHPLQHTSQDATHSILLNIPVDLNDDSTVVSRIEVTLVKDGNYVLFVSFVYFATCVPKMGTYMLTHQGYNLCHSLDTLIDACPVIVYHSCFLPKYDTERWIKTGLRN